MIRDPMDSGLCCMARHANAVPPWTCDCLCHTREEAPMSEIPLSEKLDAEIARRSEGLGADPDSFDDIRLLKAAAQVCKAAEDRKEARAQIAELWKSPPYDYGDSVSGDVWRARLKALQDAEAKADADIDAAVQAGKGTPR